MVTSFLSTIEGALAAVKRHSDIICLAQPARQVDGAHCSRAPSGQLARHVKHALQYSMLSPVTQLDPRGHNSSSPLQACWAHQIPHCNCRLSGSCA